MDKELRALCQQFEDYIQRVQNIKDQIPTTVMAPTIRLNSLGEVEFEWYINGDNLVCLTVRRSGGWYLFFVMNGAGVWSPFYESEDVLTEDFIKALERISRIKECIHDGS